MSPSFEVKDFYFSHLGLPWVSKAGLRVNNQEMWACRNKEQLLGGGTGNNLDYIHQLYHWTPTSLKDIKVWHTFPSCFYRNWTPTRWKLLTKSCRSQTSWNHKDWWSWKIHLDVNQSQKWAPASQAPCSSLPSTAFENPSLKASVEFGFSEHELLGLPA